MEDNGDEGGGDRNKDKEVKEGEDNDEDDKIEEDNEDEDDEDDDEDEDEDDEELTALADDDYEFDDIEKRLKSGGSSSLSKTVTLQMLLAEEILQPAEGAMTIEYLGQRFTGDLLADGRIKSFETNQVFSSPSAWAIHCKKIINPEKKSGCGWASAKYKGRKLDSYKAAYFKKMRSKGNEKGLSASRGGNSLTVHTDSGGEAASQLLGGKASQKLSLGGLSSPVGRLSIGSAGGVDGNLGKEKLAEQRLANLIRVGGEKVIKQHHELGARSRKIEVDMNTQVQSIPFASINKLQPFHISISSNALIALKLHSMLTTSEVVGYLAGQWDISTHVLSIAAAYPCCCRLACNPMESKRIESDIIASMEARKLILVGWYHSHPFTPAQPTIRDIDIQLSYQLKLKGPSDASYTPCVGLICAPYCCKNEGVQSDVLSYWVMPPADGKLTEHSKPMLMNYNVTNDGCVRSDTIENIKSCIDFYRDEPDWIDFNLPYNGSLSFFQKMKYCLQANVLPHTENANDLWHVIDALSSGLAAQAGKEVSTKMETDGLDPGPVTVTAATTYLSSVSPGPSSSTSPLNDAVFRVPAAVGRTGRLSDYVSALSQLKGTRVQR